MNRLSSRAIGAAILTLSLTACETIGNFFPDKQRDYRYSSEIPPLELPPELKSNAIKTEDVIHPQVSADTENSGAVGETPSERAAVETPTKTLAKPEQHLVKWIESNRRLQVNEGYEKAWLIVSKALTHKAVEITERDRSQGVFFVEYDPEKYQIKDGSIWDEVAFFFGARDSHEQSYRVRVLDGGDHTEVAVTDDNDVLVTQDPGLSLLKLLFESIKADAEEKTRSGDNSKQTNASGERSSDEERQPPAGDKEQSQDAGDTTKPDSGGQQPAADQNVNPPGDGEEKQP